MQSSIYPQPRPAHLFPLSSRVLAATETADRSWYKHEPMHENTNQIRLVYLNTTEDAQSTPHMRLEIHDLDSAPAYIALSYTWGDVNDASDVLVDGRYLLVSRNASEALAMIRRSRQEHIDGCYLDDGGSYAGDLLDFPLWMDQICIDQSNTLEKSHQVRMMASIYRKAQRVVAWLTGLPEVHRHRAFWSRPNESFLKQVSKHPYFTRLWVIQEMLLAKELYFLCPGGTLASGSNLYHSMELSKLVTDPVAQRSMSQLFNKETTVPGSLHTWIQVFSDRQCSDPPRQSLRVVRACY